MEKVSISPDQQVMGHIGLKRRQWQQKQTYEQLARAHLESAGVNNIVGINCFPKTGRSYVPSGDPNVKDIFLRPSSKGGVEIIA